MVRNNSLSFWDIIVFNNSIPYNQKTIKTIKDNNYYNKEIECKRCGAIKNKVKCDYCE